MSVVEDEIIDTYLKQVSSSADFIVPKTFYAGSVPQRQQQQLPVGGMMPQVPSPQHTVSLPMTPEVYNPTTVPPPSHPQAHGEPPAAPQGHAVGIDMSAHQSAAPLEHFERLVADEQQGSVAGAQVWGWLQNTVGHSELVTKLAERAKTGVDAMITTLDPQMKDYMDASGSIDIAVASDKLPKINGIKEGFQCVFSRVVARGLGAPGVDADPNWAPQPVGFEFGMKGAERRAKALRQSGLAPPEAVVVAVENFVFEALPNLWFDCGFLLLEDARRGITLSTLTQPAAVPSEAVRLLQHHTPPDYPLRSSGMAVPVGAAVAEAAHGGIVPQDWHAAKIGVDRQQLISAGARALAFMYREKLIEQGCEVDQGNA